MSSVDRKKHYSINKIKNHFFGINTFQLIRVFSFFNFSFYNIKKNNFKITQKKFKVIFSFIKKNYVLGTKLKDKISINIRNLKNLKTYKGFMHKKRLPVHGQKTKTNAKTRKSQKKKKN